MCWTFSVCLNTVASTLHAFSLLSSVREVLLLQSRKLRPGDAESLAVDIQLVSGRVGIGSRGDSEPTVLTTWLSYCLFPCHREHWNGCIIYPSLWCPKSQCLLLEAAVLQEIWIPYIFNGPLNLHLKCPSEG